MSHLQSEIRQGGMAESKKLSQEIKLKAAENTGNRKIRKNVLKEYEIMCLIYVNILFTISQYIKYM